MHGKLISYHTASRLHTWDYFANPTYYDIENKAEAKARYIDELFSEIWKLYFLFGEGKEWLPDLLANELIFINLGNFIWGFEPGAKDRDFRITYIKTMITAVVTETLLETVEDVLQVKKEDIGIYNVKDLIYIVARATQSALEKWNEDTKGHLSIRLRYHD